MEAKPFSVGVRVEHLQSDIDYSIVENKMESYRKKSLDYLLNALKN